MSRRCGWLAGLCRPARPGVALPALAVALACAAPAHGGWFGAEPVDAGVVSVGGLDLARDGTGAIVYVRAVEDGPHLFVSRLRNGAFEPPERVDAGIPEAATDPVVAAASGGRLAVAWRSADRILASSTDGAGFSQPVVIGAGEVGPPDAELAIQGTAFVVFAGAGDVRAVRLRAGAWEGVPQPLDVDPAQPAGDGAGRPRVAVAADGNAVVTWSEGHPDGRRRLYARRVTDLRVSALPQEVSLREHAGAPGGDADSADVTIEDDVSFAWVVWRQDFGGVSRTVARRLVGSLFEAPATIDGWALGTGYREPRVSMNGDGVGLAVSRSDAGEVGMSLLQRDAFGPPARIGGGQAPLAAGAEDRDVAVVWQAGGSLVGRRAARDEGLGAEFPLGPGTGATELGASEAGDFAVAAQRGDRAVLAVWDESPGAAKLYTSRAYKSLTRPLLRWAPSRDLWGAPTYRVVVDDKEIARTTETSFTPAKALTDGTHRWYVDTIDRRGQTTRSDPRHVRVDTRGPRLRVRVRGVRRAGVPLRVAVLARDAGAGVKNVRIDRGDGSPPTTDTRFSHRYRRGSYKLSVRARDKAGNVARRRVRLRIH